MQKFLILCAFTLSFAACSSQEYTPVNSDISVETNEAVAVETPEEITDTQASDELVIKTFTFGRVNYELDYPLSWDFAEETYANGGVYTQFYNENKEKTMMVDCDWQGGMEAEILKSDSRTFEKQGESVKVGYSIFGTKDEVGNGNIAIRLDEWSEEKSWDYYCQIFFQPLSTEGGMVEEIFTSIR